MNLDLSKKVFLIAGSSKGIGFCIAKCFVEEGAQVVITGRDERSLKKAKESLLEGNPEADVLDLLGDMQDVSILNHHLGKVIQRYGRIDGVIANIGSGREPMGVPEDSEIWQSSYDINLKASILLAQASIPFLKNQGGTITFISSIAGLEDLKAPVAYSMHKAALIAASKKLSRLLAPHKIRVNVIAPGNILCEGGSWEKKLKESPDEIKDYIEQEVPLQCFGSPEDIGSICSFLASNKAKFITGSVIIADGGQTRSF